MKISMDGKGRYSDNIFVERLWRTVKYQEVHLKAYADAHEARRELEDYFQCYNHLRPQGLFIFPNGVRIHCSLALPVTISWIPACPE